MFIKNIVLITTSLIFISACATARLLKDYKI